MLKYNSKTSLPFLFVLLAIGSPAPAFAYTYHARFTTGGYLSSERFSEASDGTTSNDFATVSSRMFLKMTELGPRKVEVIGDIRDKHDFFDKLDAERLELTTGNTFQVRQLSLRYPNSADKYYYAIGRFPVSEAGSVNNDGAEWGYRWNSALRTSLFGGLNPKRVDQSYLTLNTDSQVFGTYTLFQPKSESWQKSVYLSSALVGNVVQGHLDRFYWFNNFVYQWDSPNQIVGLIYLDFVPRTYIQSGFLSHFQQWTPVFSTTTGLSAIDVIEYSHRRGVLETLAPSPYREGSLTLRQKYKATMVIDYNLLYGQRQADALSRTEISVVPSYSKFINRHFSSKMGVGYRNNFESKDLFFRFGVGYYSKLWEFGFDTEQTLRTEYTGNVYHPSMNEITAARYISRALYATTSFQTAGSERVNVYSGFFKIGYRFGSEALAPLRDGAPPRGKL